MEILPPSLQSFRGLCDLPAIGLGTSVCWFKLTIRRNSLSLYLYLLPFTFYLYLLPLAFTLNFRTLLVARSAQAMAEGFAACAPLLPPGSRQQYHHTSFGYLLARACRRAGTDLETAWSDFARAALGKGQMGSALMGSP